MQCFGGNGYINGWLLPMVAKWIKFDSVFLLRNLDYPIGRIVRDSRLYTVGAGTQEIRRMLIGREFNDQFKQ